MNKNLVIWGMGVLLVLVAIFTATNYSKDIASQLQVNKQSSTPKDKIADISQRFPAEGFTLKNLNGKEVSLRDFKGKHVLLNFWATWSDPCRLELPAIEKLNLQNNYHDLVIISVNYGEDSEIVKRYMKENNLSFPVLLDPLKEVSKKYSIRGIPTSFFIDASGNVVKRVDSALTRQEMDFFITATY